AVAELAEIETLEEPLVAARDRVRDVPENDVGGDVLRLHHRAHLAEIRKPGRLDDLDARRFLERLELRDALRILVRAPERHHTQRLLRERRVARTERNESDE